MFRSIAVSGMVASTMANAESFQPKEGRNVRSGLEPTRRIVLVEGPIEPAGSFDQVNSYYGFDHVTEDDIAEATGATLDQSSGCLQAPMLNVEDKTVIGKVVHCIWPATHNTELTQGNAGYDIYDFGEDCGAVSFAFLYSVGSFTEGVGDGLLFPGSNKAQTLTGQLPPSPDQNQIMASTKTSFGGDATGNFRFSGAATFAMEPEISFFAELNFDNVKKLECGERESTSRLLSDDKAIREAKKGNNGARVTGYASVQFLGIGENIGGLSAANDMVGLEGDDAIGLEEALPDMGLEEADGNCFLLDMVDTLSKESVGYGIDCLWGIEGGVASIAYFVDEYGDLIANAGTTSVAGFTAGFGTGPVLQDDASPNAVAMTGSHPFDLSEDTLLRATGKFGGYRGNIRLAGAVVPPGDDFYFSCIWHMYFKVPVMPGGGGGGKKGKKETGSEQVMLVTPTVTVGAGGGSNVRCTLLNLSGETVKFRTRLCNADPDSSFSVVTIESGYIDHTKASTVSFVTAGNPFTSPVFCEFVIESSLSSSNFRGTASLYESGDDESDKLVIAADAK